MLTNFGFLDWPGSIQFEGGSISPVPEFREAADWIHAHTHQDGFLYPRIERPVSLHRIYASHVLDLPEVETEEPHRESHAFILHLLGYLLGVRLQFSDWYFDSRVPIQLQGTHNIHFSPATAQHFLTHCYRVWRGLRLEQRRLFINILAMHCRAPSYYWDWERFMTEYTALDACWNLASSQRGLPQKTPHEKRLNIMCQDLSIRYQDDASTHIAEIVRLRKDLFHEATWDGSQPCMATGEGFYQTYNLRRLNQRLFPALLGYDTGYIRTPWWIIDTLPFD